MNSITELRAFLGSEKKDWERAGRRPEILRLGVALALTLATVASAQTYTVLKSFTGSDGAYPCAGLFSAGSTLYGTTYVGGSSNCGVVFKMNTDGSGYTVLKSFTGDDGSGPYYAGLVLGGSTLYGTTINGGNDYNGWGATGDGVVFKVNTDGTGYAVLKRFTESDGWNSWAGLVLAGSALYGTTSAGGDFYRGVVFKVNTDGSGYAVLRSFRGGESDGESPTAGLVLSGSTLYGTANRGGSSYAGDGRGFGVVFKVNAEGSGFAVLKRFTGSDGA